MTSFAECCVLIPCSTIEDFPSKLATNDARSLLGAITAAWHPQLIAASGRLPTWHRADEMPVSTVMLSSPRNSESLKNFSADAESSPAESSQPSNSDSSFSAERQNAAADGKPVRLVIIPDASLKMVPASVREATQKSPIHHPEVEPDTYREIWIRVSGRADTIAKIAQATGIEIKTTMSSEDQVIHGREENTDQEGLRTIDCRDFFALGYTWWQIQVLTRRLRYTSNLDQVHFETRAVEATEAFYRRDAKSTCDGLHDCFDALAEERDHYFSSDPSLIDLTLLTPNTTEKWLNLIATGDTNTATESQTTSQTTSPSMGDQAVSDSVLKTPCNVLIDQEVAVSMLDRSHEKLELFRHCLSDPNIGWAGGGVRSSVCFDEWTNGQCEQAAAEAIEQTTLATGQPPRVYARLGGGLPTELISALATSDYCGVIPIDFLGGKGVGDEAKVIVGESGHEIEALTVKPVDANDDAGFLTLGTRLGESIDSGEIATGLLVHWPGGGCESFWDVRRAATWTLALGKFWKLEDYFVDGEHPYHHGSTSAITANPDERLSAAATVVCSFDEPSQIQQQHNLTGLLGLASPKRLQAWQTSNSDDDATQELLNELANALGVSQSRSNEKPPRSVLLVNANQPASRQTTQLQGKVRDQDPSVFHASFSQGHTDVVADVSAWGYHMLGIAHGSQANQSTVTQQSGQSPSKTASPSKNHADGNSPADSDPPRLTRWMKELGRSMSRRSKPLLDGNRMSNEFMVLTIDPQHGGLSGVYSGQGRGNRFSTRLMGCPSHQNSDSSKSKPARELAKCDPSSSGWKVIENTCVRSSVRLEGSLHAGVGAAMIRWQAEYSLERGSRLLQYRVRFQHSSGVESKDLDPESNITWDSYPVVRTAFAEASPIVRAIVREKLHRTSARKFFAPMGFVVEEGDRTTLVASHGNAFHRRIDDRFVDTLLQVQQTPTTTSETEISASNSNDWSCWQAFTFGFDVSHPVSAAMTQTPLSLPLEPTSNSSDAGASGDVTQSIARRGWLMHVTPSTLSTQVVDVCVLESGQLAIHFRVIQTNGRSASATLRFCRQVQSAMQVSPLDRPLSSASATMVELQEASIASDIHCGDDRIGWTQPGHGVVHLLVLFSSAVL